MTMPKNYGPYPNWSLSPRTCSGMASHRRPLNASGALRIGFRFNLRPSIAVIAASHDGVRDGRAERSPYFWTVVRRRESASDVCADWPKHQDQSWRASQLRSHFEISNQIRGDRDGQDG